MNPDKPKVYLTFDDGPVPGITEKILDILQDKDVLATFFNVGDNIQKYPGIFKKIVEAGHSIGNHTFHHLNGWKTSNKLYIKDIMKFNEYYRTKLFRPPYGRIKVSQIKTLRKYYHIVFWSILSGDFDPRITPEQCYENVERNLHKGAVIVFHDNYKAEKNVLHALPSVIERVDNMGYTFGTFDNMGTVPFQKNL
ncbi:MAG: polysaccharide deacetylase family protein [Bacteroidales bacterium]|nr:polysaccharide deacetylase family protein [Bacteroidales bacterium]